MDEAPCCDKIAAHKKGKGGMGFQQIECLTQCLKGKREQWGGNHNLTQTMRNTLIGSKLKMLMRKSDDFVKSNRDFFYGMISRNNESYFY